MQRIKKCLALTVWLFLLLGLVGFSQASLTDGLVAYYPFDGNADDASVNDNHGTIVGNPQFVTGKYGQALYFNNPMGFRRITQYVSIPNSGVTTGLANSSFTVALLYKSTDTVRQNGRIFGNMGAYGNNGLVIDYNCIAYPQAFAVLKDGVHTFTVATGSAGNPNAITTNNQWHWQIILVNREEHLLQEYVDDHLIDSTNISTLGTVWTSNFVIGATEANDTYGARLTAVDEVRIYNRVLTVEEIQQLAKEVVSVTIDPLGGGSVIGPSIACGVDDPNNPGEYLMFCQAAFNTDDQITLNAQENGGFIFQGWEVNGLSQGSNPELQVLMDQEQAVTARFVQLSGVSVTVDTTKGSVTSGEQTPYIHCNDQIDSVCSHDYLGDDNVALTANQKPGYLFTRWEENEVEVWTDRTYSFQAEGLRNLTAVFEATDTNLTIIIDPPEAGSVYSEQLGIICPENCEASFIAGSPISLTATANSGWVFDVWTDGATVPEQTTLWGHETLSQTFTGPRVLKAVFRSTAIASDTEITLPITALDQDEYEFIENDGDNGPAGCVPTSFTMMFLYYFNMHNPFPGLQIDTSPHSYNTERILETMAQYLSAWVENHATWVHNSTILEKMREYTIDFLTFSTPPAVLVEWDIEYLYAPRLSAHQMVDFLKQKITDATGEPVYVSGEAVIPFTSGGHAVLVTGYKRENDHDYFLINDTFNNISHWSTVEIEEYDNPDGTLTSKVRLNWNLDLYHLTINGLIANPITMTIVETIL